MISEINDVIDSVRRAHNGRIRLIPIRLMSCRTPNIEIAGGKWLSDLFTPNIFGVHREEGLAALKRALREAEKQTSASW